MFPCRWTWCCVLLGRQLSQCVHSFSHWTWQMTRSLTSLQPPVLEMAAPCSLKVTHIDFKCNNAKSWLCSEAQQSVSERRLKSSHWLLSFALLKAFSFSWWVLNAASINITFLPLSYKTEPTNDAQEQTSVLLDTACSDCHANTLRAITNYL